MDYQQKAIQWYDRGRSESDIFVKFVLFYIALEAMTHVRGGNIRGLKSEVKLLGKIDSKTISTLQEYLEHDPHKNMNPEGDNRWNGTLKNDSDLDGVMEFLIRARNNLFHGDKGPDIERDRIIVGYGNKIIEPILGAIIVNGNN